jgi:hypothetical protein
MQLAIQLLVLVVRVLHLQYQVHLSPMRVVAVVVLL